MGYESSSERWSPVQSVEKILLSVVSMLAGKSVHMSLLLSVCQQHACRLHICTAVCNLYVVRSLFGHYYGMLRGANMAQCLPPPI